MNIIDKALAKVPYKVYKNTNIIVPTIGVASMLGANILNVSELNYLSILLSTMTGFNFVSLNSAKTKDAVEIGSLYNALLEDYNKMADTFEVKTPFERYVLFSKSIYGGYLSADKSYEYNKKGVADIPFLSGAQCITGKGVCRHISPFFTDTLKTGGINAVTLGVSCPKIVVNSSILLKLIQENPSIPPSELEPYATENKLSLKDKMFANHVISVAEYDGKGYYIDPTFDEVIRMKTEHSCFYYNNIVAKNFKNPNVLSARIDKKEAKRIIQLPFGTAKEYGNIKNSTSEKIADNIDILEKFYSEHQELYQEVTDKIKVFKRGFIK